jgi:hypothetical protein
VLCCTSCALCTAPAGCVVTSVGSFYCDYVIHTCIGLRACVLCVVGLMILNRGFSSPGCCSFINVPLIPGPSSP